MDITLVATALNAAYTAFRLFIGVKSRLDPEGASLVQEQLRKISDNLDVVAQAVIDELPEQIFQQRVDELEAAVFGLSMNFRDYRRYPQHSEQWVAERERLREVVDHSPAVIGSLVIILDDLDLTKPEELDKAVKIFCLYAALIPLRAAAMEERSETYEMHDAESIQAMLLDAESLASVKREGFWRSTRARFGDRIEHTVGEPIPGPQGIRYGKLVYRFDGHFRLAGLLDPRRPDQHSGIYTQAQEMFELHKKRLFDQNGGLVTGGLIDFCKSFAERPPR
jgi:hypothetical protein